MAEPGGNDDDDENSCPGLSDVLVEPIADALKAKAPELPAVLVAKLLRQRPLDQAVAKPSSSVWLIKKTAPFVARNGPDFEAKIAKNYANNPKFSFFEPSDPLYCM
ncbi:hypothetical protein T492DRAFT_897203 [Pavlovales sp. CCMP2436]|nr:hypothetical protein T492DRAFT_897203 [Pavlovales sp. CCMP2436]